MAINVWRRRKAKDEKQDDEGTDVAEWNLSDLRKGIWQQLLLLAVLRLLRRYSRYPSRRKNPKKSR